jgi:phenylalanyl-tRNA synthetase beta chain
VGQGFEDTLNFHLVGAADNYDRMRLDRPEGAATDAPLGGAGAATIKNPYSAEYEQVRTWALPSLVLLLENNTHREYPQRVSEVGFAATRDESEPTGLDERTTVAAAVAATDAGYDDAKGHLQSLAGAFDADLSTPATDHPSFIDGRAATVELDGEAAGVVGELHPAVLVEHDLEVPAAAFEFRLDALR